MWTATPVTCGQPNFPPGASACNRATVKAFYAFFVALFPQFLKPDAPALPFALAMAAAIALASKGGWSGSLARSWWASVSSSPRRHADFLLWRIKAAA